MIRRSRRRALRKNLRNSVSDGAAFSVMVGIGETYFPAFVLAMGMGEIASGLVASIPLLVGAILQMVSPMAVVQLGSNRRWVITCVGLQAASLLPLVIAALAGKMPVAGVFAAVSLYWGGGLGAGPAWNTWMETVVPFRVRAPFFAMRTRLGRAEHVAGDSWLAGRLCNTASARGTYWEAFAVIFTVAGVCRCFSARFLSRQSETVAMHAEQRHVGFGELCSRIKAGSNERLLLYFLAVQVAVSRFRGRISRRSCWANLGFRTWITWGLLATSFLAKILMLPACGRFAHAVWRASSCYWVGASASCRSRGCGCTPTPTVQLVALQFLAGAVWAAYELAMFLLFFEARRREERTVS